MQIKHPTQPECPSCEYGRLGWIAGDQDSPGVWLCGSCNYEQQLVHWLTPGATRRLHTQPETFGDNPMYEQEYDVMSHQHWLRRMVNGGPGRATAVRRSRRPGIYQVAYTNDQYDLIGWAMYAYDELGMTNLEIFRIIERFWKQQPGQTPLVSRTVFVWKNNRIYMNRKGLAWP